MKPWVFTDKNKMSSFRSGTNSTSVGAFALGLCRPYGARFGECVVKIGMGGLCVIIVFGLGLRA